MDEQRELSDAECDAIALDEWHDWHKELGLPRDDDWPMTEWERRIIRRAYRAGAAARAVPRGEPVAWRCQVGAHTFYDHTREYVMQRATYALNCSTKEAMEGCSPLYAAPERAAGEGK